MSKLYYRLSLSLPFLIPAALFFFNPEWAVPVLELSIIFLFLTYLLQARRGRRPFLFAPGLLPLSLLGAFMLFQLIPLPPLLLKLFPKTWDLYKGTIWIPRPGTWMPLSIDPRETVGEFLRLSTCIVLYLLAGQILVERSRVKNAVRLLTLSTGLLALVGIFATLTPGWEFPPKPPAGSAILGVFAGTSSLPGLLAVILPLSLAQFLAVRPWMKYGSTRERLTEILSRPRENAHLLPFLSVVFICGFLLLHGPTSLIPGTVASISLMCLLLAIRRGYRTKALVLWVSTVFLFSAGFAVRSSVVTEPAAGTDSYTWQSSLAIFRDFPTVGTGFGTFREISPRYARALAGEGGANPLAAGPLTGGGAVGVFLGGWFLLTFLRRTFPAWLQRRNKTAITFYPGLLAVLASVPLQYAFVPHLSVPGLDFLFFFFAGLAVSASRLHFQEGKNPAEIDSVPPPLLRMLIVPASLVLAAGIFIDAGILAGKIEAARAADFNSDTIPTRQTLKATIDKVGKAALFDPLEQSYPYALGQASQALGEDGKALGFLGQALRRDPSNAKTLQDLGLIFARRGKYEKAEMLLRAGVVNDRANPDRHKTYGAWLLSRGKVDEGLSQIKRALALAPAQTPEFLKMMALYGVQDKKMRQGLPADRALPYLVYGNYLLRRDQQKAAAASFRTAILYAEKDPHPEPALFWRIYRYYIARNRYEDALDTVRAGIRVFPTDPEFRTAAAGLYEQLGITFKAVEEYRQALLLAPGNQEVREHLKELQDEQ